MKLQVHWHEGLFLQPHHLQTMQRNLLDGLRYERQLGMSYPHGLIEASLSLEALKNNSVEFTRLRAITRAGVEVNFPESAVLPPLDIEKELGAQSGAITVVLAVPKWYPTRANSSNDEGQAERGGLPLYQVVRTEETDENSGKSPQPVLARKINARLMFADDDLAAMDWFPILRVVHATDAADGAASRDPDFFPPAVLLRGSDRLYSLVKGVSDLVGANRRDLVAQLNAAGALNIQALHGPQVEQVMRLGVLNRYAARLALLLDVPAITPLQIFMELQDLLGELVALSPDRDKELFEIFKYDHDDSAIGFITLADRIRSLLKGGPQPTVKTIDFQKAAGYWFAPYTAADVGSATEIYLGIKSNEEINTYRDKFVAGSEVKLMPFSQLNSIVPGVRVEWAHDLPSLLPTNLRYFRLVRGGKMWDFAKADGKLAFRWVNKDPASWPQVALYLIVPLAEQKKKT